MLLTIQAPMSAGDLGYLVLKNPSRLHEFELSFGKGYVYYPEMTADSSTVALLLEVDPVSLVRGKGGDDGALDQYVNDRPYASSSFLSVAMSRIFGTAMSGKSKERQSLADTPLQYVATITCLPCRQGEELIRELFEPLGYATDVKRHPLDERFPDWGPGSYYTVRLTGTATLQSLLNHLYVLVPALDAEKHYWVGREEIDKLLRKGDGWLASHPKKKAIAARYLAFDRKLTGEALARLMDEDQPDPEASATENLREENDLERPLKLWELRIGAILSALRAVDAKSVADLGCGEGRLLKELLSDRSLSRIVGMDVSHRNLAVAARRLRLDQLPAMQKGRIELIHGSLMYADRRLAGFDAATVAEVIEHLDPPRLAAFERVVFEHARPGAVIVTTPNIEYNRLFPTLPAGRLRHADHRFEWTRQEFESWAHRVAQQYRYEVKFLPVGQVNAEAGSPTQMGVFTR